jgi:hypothetical protein
VTLCSARSTQAALRARRSTSTSTVIVMTDDGWEAHRDGDPRALTVKIPLDK